MVGQKEENVQNKMKNKNSSESFAFLIHYVTFNTLK